MGGRGPKGAASLISRYGRIEDFPAQVLGERRDLALLFKKLATLRTDAPLFTDVDELQWHGPTERFSTCAARIRDPRLLDRADKAFAARRPFAKMWYGALHHILLGRSISTNHLRNDHS